MARSGRATPSQAREGAIQEIRGANKGGTHDIGKGLSSAADKNDGQLSDAFAKHNAKGDQHQDSSAHVPFAKD